MYLIQFKNIYKTQLLLHVNSLVWIKYSVGVEQTLQFLHLFERVCALHVRQIFTLQKTYAMLGTDAAIQLMHALHQSLFNILVQLHRVLINSYLQVQIPVAHVTKTEH